MTRNFHRSLKPLIVSATLFAFAVLSGPANGQQSRALVVTGYAGEAPVISSRGRTYVDLEALATVLHGTLGYQGTRMVLVLPKSEARRSPATKLTTAKQGSAATPSDPSQAEPKLSKEFVNAGIESLAEMREWASTLALTIKSGYPVGNAMADYQARAAKGFALAHAAASNESDRQALQLLTNEFENLRTWSNNLVQARNSMNAANLTLSQDALLNDALSQKLLRCWQFLGPMLASGRFEDNGSCR